MANRRKFLQGSLVAPLAGTAFTASAATPKRDYFKELGVQPIIKAADTLQNFTA